MKMKIFHCINHSFLHLSSLTSFPWPSLFSYKIKQQQNVIKQIYTKQPENNDKEKNKNGDRNLTGWKFIELTE